MPTSDAAAAAAATPNNDDSHVTPSTVATVPIMEWPTDSNAYQFSGKIGQGAFASVWKAQTQTTTNPATADATQGSIHQDELVAVKILNLDHVDSDLQEIRMEVQLMRLSLHPNILPCHTAFLSQTQLWVVTPFMSKGSATRCLSEMRRRRSVSCALEPFILYILEQTLLGLQYIHDNGHIHRDVKGSNILLNGQGEIKIADFGVSGWLIPQNEKAKTFVGTPCWMAPEVMEQIHGYDYKADLWSLGITALELAKGYAPYAKYPPMKVLILTIQEDPPSLATYDYEEAGDSSDDGDGDYNAQEWSANFNSIITWLLQKNPADRPTCQALLKSSLMTGNNTFSTTQEELKTQLCDVVEDVGMAVSEQQQQHQEQSSSSFQEQQLPGTTPVWMIQSEDRPAGTTWVFADGSSSQVLSKKGGSTTITSTAASNDDDDDVLTELDQYGENYTRSSPPPPSAHNASAAANDYLRQTSTATATTTNAVAMCGPDDGLDDFLDEFETLTAGENFQRTITKENI